MINDRSIVFNIVSTIVFFVVLIALIKIFSDMGDAKNKPSVIYASIEILEEAWGEGDLDRLHCNEDPGSFYRYKEIVAIHAAMCAQILGVNSKLGEEWVSPTPSKMKEINAKDQ